MKTLLLGLICLSLAGCATIRSPMTLRVMTYNIHHAEGLDGKVDLQRIARIITENKADLVALQEVDRNTQRTGRRDIPAELAALTGMGVAFGKNIDLQGGEYGNAILSRFPITAVTNHFLPQIVPGEQRGVLEATIDLSNRKISFCSVHLDHRREEADRLASADRLRDLFACAKHAVMIAGDFNGGPDSETYKRIAVWLSDAWKTVGVGSGFTIPAENPRARIDYIWHSTLKPLSARVLTSDASDHLPLLADFEVP